MQNNYSNNALGRFSNFLKKIRIPSRVIFLIIGLLSTIWFLFRVIPKPSRASYPCIRTAAPFMSAFVIYLLSISVSVFAFKKFRAKLLSSKYIPAFAFFTKALSPFTYNAMRFFYDNCGRN